MTTRLDPITLLDLAPLADDLAALAETANNVSAENPEWVAVVAAGATLDMLVMDIRSAAAADPGCVECRGRGWTDLPAATLDPHDVDIEEHPCPVCRPWPRGFPGFRIGNLWRIAPYGPGENVNTLRTVPSAGAR